MIYDTSYSLAANTESFWHKLVKKKNNRIYHVLVQVILQIFKVFLLLPADEIFYISLSYKVPVHK